MIMIIFIMFLLSIASQIEYMTSAAVTMPLSSETDQMALLAFKDKLTNGDPDALPSWNKSLHFCEWEGVICSRRHKRVTSLQLQNQDLGGILAPSLGNLTFLREMSLTSINLHGQIPREVGHLKRLQILDLRQNNLHGEIPIEMINCSSLQVIILLYNNLTGEVPSWFGSMMQLTQLGLGANGFVGSIPPSLGNLSSLEKLSLAYNQLEGSITPTLGRLSTLKFLGLGVNKFSGQVPPSLYNLSNIQVLDFTENQLVGNFLSNLPMAFPNLEILLCGGNRFTGTFPSSISNLSELQQFQISKNDFYGPISPTVGSLHKLQIFNVGRNRFGNGRAHDLDFLSSLTNCTQLQKLGFYENYLGGVFPDIISNLSTNLVLLGMALNQISGRIPEGIGKLVNLATLDMEGNFLEGTIPDSIGKLKNLGVLWLDENKFYGNIPLVIGNLTMLSDVDLSSNKFEGLIPFTLGYCTNMQRFSAYGNNLSGNIPNQTFGYQQGLIQLSLYSNSFTGSIPSDLGNLNHLSILHLQDNKLIGEIPVRLSACTALTELVLERNSFHGSIPSFLGSLLSLEILDLSNNNFSSTIPHELVNLTFLNALNLSFNHLSGEVPVGGVFNNVTAISLAGNKDLCGGIPQLNLPTCSTLPLKKKHKRSVKKKVILIIAFGGVLISSVAFIISIYLLKKKQKRLSTPSLALQYGYVKVSYGELHQATNGFSSLNLIGTGSSGSVYRGTLVHFERPVAVKVLNLQTRGASKSFMSECKALGKMKHRNLLNILTCCSGVDYKGDDFKAIVFEFMPNGSLETLLHNTIEDSESTNLSLNLMQRVNIALDVAFALDYLHNDSEEAVVHCDVKPSNVLLDDDIVAHLGDFGLARLLHGHATSYTSSNQASSSVIKGTIGYLPPEYGAGGSVSPQGDIYSYGILLLEILTGKRPTDGMFGEDLSLHKFCKLAIPEAITEIVDSRLITPFDEGERRITQQKNMECLVSFARIGVACSEEFPTQRMNIKDVIMELHAIKQKLLP